MVDKGDSLGPHNVISIRADLHVDGTIFASNCCMQPAYLMSATRIVSSKSDVQNLHDSRTQHEKCRRVFKQVLKPYGSRSHSQNVFTIFT